MPMVCVRDGMPPSDARVVLSGHAKPAPRPGTFIYLEGDMGLAFPKPKKRSSLKRAKHMKKTKRIAAVRSAVMNRDQRCRLCLERGPLHMHEVIFRSAGRSLEDTFSLMNCLALCDKCHAKVHAREIRLSFEDESIGCNGEIVVTPNESRFALDRISEALKSSLDRNGWHD